MIEQMPPSNTAEISMVDFQTTVEWRHAVLGLGELSLDQVPNPPIEVVESADGARNRYQVFGDRSKASNIVLQPMHYSTYLDDASVRVGLNHKQKVLGPDYAVVGVEVFSPAARLTNHQRQSVNQGSFKPFATRLDTIIDHLAPSSYQALYSHGFSFGADISAEYANRNAFDPQFGNYAIERYGIYDPARTKARLERLGRLGGRLAVDLNFGRSGADLYDNVIASDSVALLQADQIDPRQPLAKQRYMARVSLGLARYLAANRADNWAMTAAFGTSQTVNQINELADRRYIATMAARTSAELTDQRPHLVLGETVNGISRGFLRSLQPSADQERYLIDGDHSVADNLQTGSALVLATVGIRPF